MPDSTTEPIPFQSFTWVTDAPVVVECATDTSAHGWPADGEASYIVADSIPVDNSPMLSPAGGSMYSAAKSIVLPSECWKYFGSYDFWQANVRLSQMVPNLSGGTTKSIFSSHDEAGLECLGSEVGQSGSWFGAFGMGCEMTYSNSPDQIPYIVMRIEGYSNGVAAAQSALPQRAYSRAGSGAPPSLDKLDLKAPAVQKVEAVSPAELEKSPQKVRNLAPKLQDSLRHELEKKPEAFEGFKPGLVDRLKEVLQTKKKPTKVSKTPTKATKKPTKVSKTPTKAQKKAAAAELVDKLRRARKARKR